MSGGAAVVICVILVVGGVFALVVAALMTAGRIDLDALTEDWEQREAADPQRSLKDRRLAGKARRRARRAGR